MEEITLNFPLDMHLHLRDAKMLELVAPLTSKTFAGALVMPNLVPPVCTAKEVEDYYNRIKNATGSDDFEPFMTIFFKPYPKEFLQNIKDKILALKLYPAGITTNSEGGVSNFDIEELRLTLEAMSDLQIPLCVHGETNGFVMDREAEFMSIYETLASNFPNLKIVMEHITTKEAVDMLDNFDNLFATITLHHLLITLDDVAGGMLKPHLFCKPIAKKPVDREALIKVALEGHPKVMFGSDSAPHPKHKKEACGCAAGVFTAPIALQVLAQLFHENGKLENLQKFVSDNACKVYNLKKTEKIVTLIQKEFEVPNQYSLDSEIVIPMFAGEKIKWSVK